MNTLKYKGYIGSVAYSEPDKVFFGKIEGIDGLVNYEGESVKELTDAFHEAVEDYLIFCEEHNCKPEKSYTGTFNVRIAPDTHRDIANLAAEAGISINAFVKRALGEAVKHPWVTPGSLVQGYGAELPEPAMLMEPEQAVQYGSRDIIKLSVPRKDLPMAKEIAKRMGWDVTAD
ncbi:MAG: type II toxin-antitoxin system HicB family antitoxin [Bacteroidales bacterium]|nr:type II toxin-antitoxin system HicB family antitoxin [Bacteroidales bacterium]